MLPVYGNPDGTKYQQLRLGNIAKITIPRYFQMEWYYAVYRYSTVTLTENRTQTTCIQQTVNHCQ